MLLTCISATFTLIIGDADIRLDVDKNTCSGKDDCDVTLGADDIQIDEKTKYIAEKAKEYHKMQQNNININLSDEKIKENIANIRKTMHKHEPVTDNNSNKKNTPDIKPKEPPALYEFPPLKRLDPVKVGYEVELELEEGKFYKRITRAVHPPIFEVQDFLSSAECLEFIYAAGKLGLETSNLFGADINDELNKKENSEITRISDQTWIRKRDISQLWDTLVKRLSKVLEMPVDFLRKSEPIQLVKYNPGGHYHAHIDTSDDTSDETANLPCCFQMHCGASENTAKWSECCRLCRYMTAMYYLSDVEEGGETAFPLADMPNDLYEEKVANKEGDDWYNLSKYCYNSTLVVTPRKGSAIIWYSHFVDEETGYLGNVDKRSHHGGCDIIKGTKWIANNFISAATYKDRFKPSVWGP